MKSNIIFDKKILSVLPWSIVRPSVVVRPHPPPAQKLRYFRVFSLFNVILCRPPGGARQYPRSGYFLVKHDFFSKVALLIKHRIIFLLESTRYAGTV